MNLYVIDYSRLRVRKITSYGMVSLLAGSGQSLGDGVGSNAYFYQLLAIAVDTLGYVYVNDYAYVRKISPAGSVTSMAGLFGTGGTADGYSTAARFGGNMWGLAVDTKMNLFVCDTGYQTIRMITSAGFVTTIAGSAGVAGVYDGALTAATFYTPNSIAVDTNGNIFVGEISNPRVRMISVAAYCAPGSTGFNTTHNTNCTAVPKGYYNPNYGSGAYYKCSVALVAGAALCVSGGGNCPPGTYYASSKCAPVPAGYYNPFYSSGVYYYCPKATIAGAASCHDAVVSCSKGYFYNTTGCTQAPAQYYSPQAGSGSYYFCPQSVIAGTAYCGINVTTLAGITTAGYSDGIYTSARFGTLGYIAVDTQLNLYVADNTYHAVRKINSVGVVTTIAGSSVSSGLTDGLGTSAKFATPSGVAVDTLGNIFVTDTGYHNLRQISSAGAVTTLAGSTGGSAGSVDGTGSNAKFYSPSDVAVDSMGSIYVSDYYNNKVWRKLLQSCVKFAVVSA